LTCHQADLWRFVDSLPPGNQVLDVPSKILRPTRAAEALTHNEMDRQRRQRDLEKLRAEVAEYESRLLDAERATESAEGRAERERARADAAEYWLADIQGSASWRVTAPARSILRALRRAAKRFRPA
jgi:hypothetical protein